MGCRTAYLQFIVCNGMIPSLLPWNPRTCLRDDSSRFPARRHHPAPDFIAGARSLQSEAPARVGSGLRCSPAPRNASNRVPARGAGTLPGPVDPDPSAAATTPTAPFRLDTSEADSDASDPEAVDGRPFGTTDSDERSQLEEIRGPGRQATDGSCANRGLTARELPWD